MRGGEIKKMRRGVIKVMMSGVNEIKGGWGEERGEVKVSRSVSSYVLLSL